MKLRLKFQSLTREFVMSDSEKKATETKQSVQANTLKTSRYDRFTSGLLACNFMLAFGVVLMFALWVTRSFTPDPPDNPIPTRFGGGGATTVSVELATPELQELGLTEVSFESMIEQVGSLAENAASGEDNGVGKGIGDEVGPPDDNREPEEPKPAPPWDRWRVKWDVKNLQVYARQLDHFQIELGCAGGKQTIDYASSLSASQPLTREGKGCDEDRIFMTWRPGPMQDADRQLLRRAGIETVGRVMLQFYPEELQQRITDVEVRYAATRSRQLIDVKRTVLGVRSALPGYEFYVIEQSYRSNEL